MRSIRILCLAICAALALVQGSPLQAQAGDRWAICVGIDKFDDKVFRPLSCASADAELLAQALRESGGFRPDNVFLLTSAAAGKNRPTRANILATLNRLTNALQPQDSLVVFFATHGVEVDKQHYIITEDTDSAHVAESAISTSQLQDKVASSKAGNVVIIADCCRQRVTQSELVASRGIDGPGGGQPMQMTRAMANNLIFQPSHQGQVVATLFACSPEQLSWEWKEKGHGYFTYFLVDGLRGKAARGDGMVRLTDLVGYMEKEVPRMVRLNEKQEQVPWMQSQGTGLSNLIVAAPGPLGGGGGSAPPPPPPAPGPGSEQPRDTTPPREPVAVRIESAAGASTGGTLQLEAQSNPYGLDIDAYAEKGGGDVNIRVRLMNNTGQPVEGPVQVRLYLRGSADPDWVLAREWTDLARIPTGYRVSRDFLTHPETCPASMEPRFGIKVSVLAPGVQETSRQGIFISRFPSP